MKNSIIPKSIKISTDNLDLDCCFLSLNSPILILYPKDSFKNENKFNLYKVEGYKYYRLNDIISNSKLF